MTYDEYKKQIASNSNATIFSRDSYSSLNNNGPDIGGYKAYKSPYAFNPNVDTTDGLYNLAYRSGLQKDANRVLDGVGGESNRFFSGGPLSDFMDILNVGSYGMVGLLKGKGFMEGIKNRETFSSNDSLGQYGWMGKVMGSILDIAVDPLTYISPWKMFTKVPGVVKTLEKANTALLGEFSKIDVGSKTYFHREGGFKPLTWMADNLVYGFSVEKNTLEGIQKLQDAKEVAKATVDQLIGNFASIDPKIADQALRIVDVGTGGRAKLARVPLEELQRTMSNADLAKIKPIYDAIEKNANDLVDLGVLSKTARQSHIDDYVTMFYDEYLRAYDNAAGKAGVGLKNQSRKELSREQIMNKGVVQNASVVFGNTLLKQTELVHNARLQQYLADNIAFTAEDLTKNGANLNHFTRVADSPTYEINRGKQIDMNIELGKLNKAMKPALKELRKAYDGNTEMLSHIQKLEDEFKTLPSLTGDALAKALSDLRSFVVEGQTRNKMPSYISEGQSHLAGMVSDFLKNKAGVIKAGGATVKTGGSIDEFMANATKNSTDLFNEFMQTKQGLALERAFEDPQVMWNYKTPQQFFNEVLNGDTKTTTLAHEVTDPASIAKYQQKQLDLSQKYAQRFGELKSFLPQLRQSVLRDVQKNLVNAESKYSDLFFQKEDLLNKITENKVGNLAGKYLPKEIWDMVKGTFEPKKQFGEAAVLLFKHGKVIWNPAAYPRNMLSAMIQNWWKTGLGPWNIHSYIGAYNALKNNDKDVQLMKSLGFHENAGVINELTSNYIQTGLIGDAVAKSTGNPLPTIKKQFKHFDKWATNAYGHVDNIAKVAAFKHGISKGLSPEEALKNAYIATFNYSHVTPFVHAMRRAIWGVPFVTFNLKAVPLVAGTLANAPHRISVFGKARNDLFQAAGVQGQQEQEAMPDYMRDSQFMLRLPYKDTQGRSMYFDLSYIIPFGAIITGDYLKDPLQTNPVLQTVKELSQNKTFSGYKIFNESDPTDQVVQDIFIHVSKLLLPPVITDELPQGYQEDGTRVLGTVGRHLNTQDMGAGQRTYYQDLFKTIGFGVTPYALDSRQRTFAYRQKQALQQLLVQHGILNEFTVPYVPKDKKQPIVPISAPGPSQDVMGR